MLTVWGRANSINVMKVLWTCEELDVTYHRIDAGMEHGEVDAEYYLEMNPNGQVPFTWDYLSDGQRQLVDRDTYNTILAAADPSLNTATASDILNYVRGERLHEKQNDTETGSLGDLRNRYSVLGDVTGTPVYIGPPKELLRKVDGYTTFLSAQSTRAGRVVFGANAGMLQTNLKLTRINCRLRSMRRVSTQRGEIDFDRLERMMQAHDFGAARCRRWRDYLDRDHRGAA